MDRSEKFRLIYSIFLGVFTVAVGIAIICVAADIYYSGKGTEVIYSREIVGDRLTALAIPLIFLIAAVIFGAIFPLYKVKAARPPEKTLSKLQSRLPESGEGEEYNQANKRYISLCSDKFDLHLGTLTILLVCTIAILCYVLNTANFMSEDITTDIFSMVKNILPWTAFAFAVLILDTIYNGIYASKQVQEIKTLIKTGNGTVLQKTEPAFITAIKSIIAKPAFLWAVRGAVFVLAVVFIIVGIVNGGAHDVLAKAVNICQECIGLG